MKSRGRVVDAAMTTRRIAQIIPAEHTYEGDGFGVFRPFPQTRLEMLDPFLLLDEMEPKDHAPSEAIGTSDHPHRGFETVTYMLEGAVEHADSQGNHGTIRAGGVQWMTAGAGIVHREQPAESIRRNGGRTHGFQLWVNLPAAEKMTAPSYQGFEPADIPTLAADGVTLRVVAGELAGLRGVAATRSPVVYARLTIEPGATFRTELPADDNVGLYVFAGSGTTGPDEREVNEREFVIYDRASGSITITANERLEALLLAGRPLNESVARYGPFVMNTRQQLIDAFEDYQSGRMGAIAAVRT
jgi:redox-sensitive bicupin YhaK (pirin superfamily)